MRSNLGLDKVPKTKLFRHSSYTFTRHLLWQCAWAILPLVWRFADFKRIDANSIFRSAGKDGGATGARKTWCRRAVLVTLCAVCTLAACRSNEGWKRCQAFSTSNTCGRCSCTRITSDIKAISVVLPRRSRFGTSCWGFFAMSTFSSKLTPLT